MLNNSKCHRLLLANKRGFSILLLLLTLGRSTIAQPTSAVDLLNKSIRYHDPDGIWSHQQHLIDLEEKRPDGTIRHTHLTIELEDDLFILNQKRDEYQIECQIIGTDVKIQIDGENASDSSLIKKYRLTSDRMLLLRNYYTYLYGLPMKLKDPGTLLRPEILDTTFQGKEVYGLEVTYDPNVGADIWYFYFDKNNYSLCGYRFYHYQGANDGEYITLDGEIRKDKWKIPKNRKWFTHQEGKFLGEDVVKALN